MKLKDLKLKEQSAADFGAYVIEADGQGFSPQLHHQLRGSDGTNQYNHPGYVHCHYLPHERCVWRYCSSLPQDQPEWATTVDHQHSDRRSKCIPIAQQRVLHYSSKCSKWVALLLRVVWETYQAIKESLWTCTPHWGHGEYADRAPWHDNDVGGGVEAIDGCVTYLLLMLAATWTRPRPKDQPKGQDQDKPQEPDQE